LPPFVFGDILKRMSNLRVVFREYVREIALGRKPFLAKMQQISFNGRALPGPRGGAYSTPPNPWLDSGALLLREGAEWREGKGKFASS